jgi:hypothetical protein
LLTPTRAKKGRGKKYGESNSTNEPQTARREKEKENGNARNIENTLQHFKKYCV